MKDLWMLEPVPTESSFNKAIFMHNLKVKFLVATLRETLGGNSVAGLVHQEIKISIRLFSSLAFDAEKLEEEGEAYLKKHIKRVKELYGYAVK